jgi:signal transduction histidine kinase
MSGGSTRGAGLGLSIVRLIVDKLGGHIWVEDRVPGDPSKGSVFAVQLRKA